MLRTFLRLPQLLARARVMPVLPIRTMSRVDRKNLDILQHEIANELRAPESFDKFFTKNHARLGVKHYCDFLDRLLYVCEKETPTYANMVNKDRMKCKEMFLKALKNLEAQPGVMQNKEVVLLCMKSYASPYIVNEPGSKDQMTKLDGIVAGMFTLLSDAELYKVLKEYLFADLVPKKTLQALSNNIGVIASFGMKYIFEIADSLTDLEFMEPRVISQFVSRFAVLSSKFGAPEFASTLQFLTSSKEYSERHKVDPQSWKYDSLVRFYVSALYSILLCLFI